MTDDRQWSDWIAHDGKGFPADIPHGHWLHAEGVDYGGVPQISVGILNREGRYFDDLAYSWDWSMYRSWSRYAYRYSKVERYRIGRAATADEIAERRRLSQSA